jgi:hypothetical protein
MLSSLGFHFLDQIGLIKEGRKKQGLGPVSKGDGKLG